MADSPKSKEGKIYGRFTKIKGRENIRQVHQNQRNRLYLPSKCKYRGDSGRTKQKPMQDTPTGPDPQILKDLVTVKMPFGKYKETIICNLPVSYLEWFQRKGFPKGKLGILLMTMHEIKLNGLDYLLKPLKNNGL